MAIGNYRSDLRAIARGYWIGLPNGFTQDQFQNMMFDAIDRGLRDAWIAGAKSVGIDPGDITPAEQVQLATLVFKEYARVPGLSTFIYMGRKGVGKLASVIARIELWVNRWNDVYNKAKLSGEQDPKLEWVYDPTKEHCSTCAKLHGKVKRKSQWVEMGIFPQSPPNPMLACGGWKCGCKFVQTTKPLSRGRFPSVP